jgi:OOP family OmpA-OmpF porin
MALNLNYSLDALCPVAHRQTFVLKPKLDRHKGINMKYLSLALVAASAVMASSAAFAADADAVNPAYLVDGSGRVVHNAVGECWRTGSWSASLATPPCDPGPASASVATVVAQAPSDAEVAPRAAVVPAAVVMAPQKFSLSGNALFGFDKSSLRPESRTLLDKLASKLDGVTSERVTVTGYTDRIGSAEYNQQLSERRAMAVKDYLVSKDLSADRIDAKGMGKAQPVTTATDCVGKKVTAALITCLQPDRRVDVEITGTQPDAVKN